MVAVEQPSAESDAVGLIVEFFRIDLVEVVEFAVLQDLGVQVGNAVDGIAIMDIHVCHVYAVFRIDDGNAWIMESIIYFVVQFVNDRKQLRYGFL